MISFIQRHETLEALALGPVNKSKFHGAFVLNCRVDLHAIDATPARLSRRPPRHRRDACSIAWRCRCLTARRSQPGRVIAEKGLSASDALVDFHTGRSALRRP